MTDCRRLSFSSNHPRAKRKAGRPRLGWEDVIQRDLKEMGTSWDGGLEYIGMEEEERT